MSSLRPKKARPTTGNNAWWYDERGSISVYIQGENVVLSCRIKRSDLLKYIERTKGALK